MAIIQFNRDATLMPKRSWLRFSLRTAFVVFTVLAAVFGFRANEIRHRHQALAAIRSLGGTVLYDDEGFELDSRRLGFFAWLIEMVGARQPARANLTGNAVTDEVLQRDILPLNTLYELMLADVSVTDEGLLQLEPLQSLKTLRCIRDTRNELVLRELALPTYIDVKDVPLADLFAYLTDLHGIQLSLDIKALAAAGIDPEVLVITGSVKNKPNELGEALNEVLGPYGLGWVIAEGQLVITTREAARADRRVKTMAALRRALPKLNRLEID